MSTAADRSKNESLSKRFDQLIAESRDNLAPLPQAKPTRFEFTTNGVDFKGCLEPDGNGTRLSLEADLGPLPFSAENNSSREKWLKLLRASGSDRPDHHRLDARKRIRFFSQTKLNQPLTGQGLLNQLVITLLSLRGVMYGEIPATAKAKAKGSQLAVVTKSGFTAEHTRP